LKDPQSRPLRFFPLNPWGFSRIYFRLPTSTPFPGYPPPLHSVPCLPVSGRTLIWPHVSNFPALWPFFPPATSLFGHSLPRTPGPLGPVLLTHSLALAPSLCLLISPPRHDFNQRFFPAVPSFFSLILATGERLHNKRSLEPPPSPFTFCNISSLSPLQILQLDNAS